MKDLAYLDNHEEPGEGDGNGYAQGKIDSEVK